MRMLGVLLSAAGTLVFAREVAAWLRFGYWSETPLYTLWLWMGGPRGEILSLWPFQQPLAFMLFVVGAAMIFAGRAQRP